MDPALTPEHGIAARQFDAAPTSAGLVRRFVVECLERLGWHDVIDDAVLCASELASNAVLHGRAPFDVRIDARHDAVRVDVTDARPHELPFVLPVSGHELRVLEAAATGRGLRIVAAVAHRWGVTTTATTKTVWVEFGMGPAASRSEPLVVVGHDAAEDPEPDAVVLPMRHLPVVAAIGSGLQVDGLVREIQLGLFEGAIDDAERTRLYDLLDASAPARLSGRRAAYAALAAGDRRFAMDVRLTAAMSRAFVALTRLLAELPSRIERTTASPSPDVVAFREWLSEEVGRQLNGEAPSNCPLPD